VSLLIVRCLLLAIYICNIVAKGKQLSSLMLRFFLSKDPEILTAFVVYVRPILDNTPLLSGLPPLTY